MTRQLNISSTEIKISSLAQAEEDDVEYYAGIDWKESVVTVEKMRKAIWSKEYKLDKINIVRLGHLKDDRDDFE